MACGDKYAHLIRTVDGHTPEDPCGYWCNLGNWEDWEQSMEALRAKVYSKHGELQRQAITAGRGDVTDKIERLYIGPGDNAYAATLALEPSALDAFPGDADISAAISKAIETMDLYACALEQVDAGYVELGLGVPETPGAVTAPPPSAEGDADWWGWAKKAGIAVGVGAFGYLVLRYWLSRRMLKAQQEAAAAGPPPIEFNPRQNRSAA